MGWRTLPCWFICVLFLIPSLAGSQQTDGQAASTVRKVAVFGSGPGRYDVDLIKPLVFQPSDIAFDVAFEDRGEWLTPQEFSRYAAVVISTLGGKEARAWTAEEMAAVERYVRDGGHVIFTGLSTLTLAGKGRDLAPLSHLLGGGALVEVKAAQILDAQNPWTAGVKFTERVPWRNASHALGKLTTAKALVGTANQGGGAIVAVNPLGKGHVAFFALELFRLPSGDADAYAHILFEAVKDANPTLEPSRREPWIAQPLGPNAAPPATRPTAPIKRPLQPTLKTRPVHGPPLTLVENGQARATLVLADRPSSAAREAARELQTALRKMSGAELPVVAESKLNQAAGGDCLVLLGDTQLGRSKGISADGLPLEGYRIKSEGNLLFIVGSDLRPENQQTLYGTRHGVIALLERHLGFRWLWPGEVGEVVPHEQSVRIPPLDEEDAPAMRLRKMRNYGAAIPAATHAPDLVSEQEKQATRTGSVSDRIQSGLDRLDLSSHEMGAWFADSFAWFPHQRLGASYKLEATHAYTGWWEKFGQEHPKWFALQRNGLREQFPQREQFCNASAELITQIAAAKIEQLKANPDLDCVSISPNDGGKNSFCLCEECRKLDPPDGPAVSLITRLGGRRIDYPYVSLSDRLMNWYDHVADDVARTYPDKWLAAMAYSAYRDPPLAARIHPNLLVIFVGMGYFDDSALAVDRARWEAWASVARNLYLRPNAFHIGHAMPAVFVKKIDQDIKRCYQTGMIGADWDSVIHHWSTQGLNYYVLARLLWDPSQDAEAIVQDYCQKGFGPAAKEIRQYFQQLEDLSNQMAGGAKAAGEQQLREEEMDTGSRRNPVYDRIPDCYNADAIAQLNATLNRARAAVAGDTDVLKRIEFLADGVRYAQAQAKLFAYRKAGIKDKTAALKILEERNAVLRDLFHRQPWAVNIAFIAWREGGLWKEFGWNGPPRKE